MTKNDRIKIILLTAICAAVFVGIFYAAMQYPLVGIYGMVFFAMYPKIKSACKKKKEGEEEP